MGVWRAAGFATRSDRGGKPISFWPERLEMTRRVQASSKGRHLKASSLEQKEFTRG